MLVLNTYLPEELVSLYWSDNIYNCVNLSKQYQANHGRWFSIAKKNKVNNDREGLLLRFPQQPIDVALNGSRCRHRLPSKNTQKIKIRYNKEQSWDTRVSFYYRLTIYWWQEWGSFLRQLLFFWDYKKKKKWELTSECLADACLGNRLQRVFSQNMSFSCCGCDAEKYIFLLLAYRHECLCINIESFRNKYNVLSWLIDQRAFTYFIKKYSVLHKIIFNVAQILE